MSHLPDVLYIGLQKTGSTFLRNYFWSHDELYCDRNGAFFQTSAADVAARGVDAVRADYAGKFPERPPRACHIDMYESLGLGYVFRGCDAWSGAAFIDPDGSLSTGPARPDPEELARRIRAVLPEARILITIRSQLTWLTSGYAHFFAHLPKDRRCFAAFLASPEGKMSLDAAHFDRVVAVYDRMFGRDRVHVVPLECLERAEEATLRELTAFLGVTAKPYAPETKSFNRGSTAARGLVRGSDLRSRLIRLLPRESRERRRIDAAMEVLRFVFAAGNVRLSARLGLDLAELGYPV